MGVAFAVLAALTYGAGDFFGGIATKRGAVATVVAVSGLVGLALAAVTLVAFEPAHLNAGDVRVGAIAGCVSPLALGALYRGLAIGRMSVVAPITAVVAAVLPVVFGVFHGERPHALAWIGIALAIVAVALVSTPAQRDVDGREEPPGRGLAEAAIAGCGFGLIYILLSQTSHGMWPLIAMRSVSVTIAAAAAIFLRPRVPLQAREMPAIAAAGLLDMGANILYMMSLRATLLAIAAVITSLYPGSTVMLARFVLHERLRAMQWAGVSCAFVAIVCIAVS